MSAKPRLSVLVSATLDQFLDDLLRGLSDTYEVRKWTVHSTDEVDAALAWGDLIWLEWCNDVAVYASTRPEAVAKPVVCRLHRFEVFSDYPGQVAWPQIDRLLVVAPHLETLLKTRWPDLLAQTHIEVFRNGVDLERYDLAPPADHHQLAFVGYLHARKSPVLLLQVLAALVANDARYRLSIAGTFQDPMLEWYWSHQVQAFGLQDHVQFDGWQEDMAAWLADKHTLLSTSLHESFGYAIAEAMARGRRAVIHHFPCAEEIWPHELLFRTVEEAVELIEAPAAEGAQYRRFVEKHYDLRAQVAQARRVLDELAAGRTSRPAPRPADSFLDRPGLLRTLTDRLVKTVAADGHP
ncbi:MAG: glycosyltransferase [Bacteroidota bacterium]